MRLGDITQVDSPLPAGLVVSQSPAAGGTAIPNTAVNVTISTGFNAVPESRGAPLGDATTIMERAGFLVSIASAADPGAPDGAVIAQSIAAGASMPVGTVITLTVNEAGDAPDQPGLEEIPAQVVPVG